MDLKCCRLKQQDRLAEFFVADVTARTAADLLGVNRKTAAYFITGCDKSLLKRWTEALPSRGK
jgi:transposase-like protein